MAIRYFKKFTPSNPVVVTINGDLIGIKFDAPENVIGYYASDREEIQSQLVDFIQKQRYGLSEISEAEFHAEYVQKKTEERNQTPAWREELSRSAGLGLVNREIVSRVGGERLQAALGVRDHTDIRPGPKQPVTLPVTVADGSPPPAAPQTATPAPKPEFKPPVGPRPQRKAKGE